MKFSIGFHRFHPKIRKILIQLLQKIGAPYLIVQFYRRNLSPEGGLHSWIIRYVDPAQRYATTPDQFVDSILIEIVNHDFQFTVFQISRLDLNRSVMYV